MSRYAESHKNPQGPGDARPTAFQVVDDEGLKGKLTGKVMIVTGVSSGIGVETLRALHRTGATVYGTVRDIPRSQHVVDEIRAEDPNNKAKVELLHVDLTSFDSIREAAAEFLSKEKTLNIIVNNAGIMACPYGKTKDGWESQFGTNHLGHFLLFQLLKDTLLASATPDFPSRVVSVTSTGHRANGVFFEDPNFEKIEYQPWAGYGQAKTANIWFSNEIERRYGSKNLHSTSLHPGGIATPLQKHVDPELLENWKTGEESKKVWKSTEQGAATSVYAALSNEWKTKGGRYLSNCVEQPAHNPELGFFDEGYAPHAYDPESEKKLWAMSLKAVGVADDQ